MLGVVVGVGLELAAYTILRASKAKGQLSISGAVDTRETFLR